MLSKAELVEITAAYRKRFEGRVSGELGKLIDTAFRTGLHKALQLLANKSYCLQIRVGDSERIVGAFNMPSDAEEWARKNVDARIFPWKVVPFAFHSDSKKPSENGGTGGTGLETAWNAHPDRDK